ncbi:MAG: long-chain fatty acid--CoA ligase [Candidatus Rokuibacteriota bacterium]|nr:MAG: long-chain fatty acid--CoA ligase [Candidatus Rokubacteria bacterium]
MNFEALRASTLPGLLVERARTRPDRVAFRSKELGIWRETTWRGLAERVAALANGFAREYGIGRGETVAIVGNPCPEWTIADLAAQALGAITYGIYPTSAPGEVRHLLQHGGASLIVAEDQEHLDKTLEVLDECPNVRAVLVIDIRALFMYRHPRVRPLAEVEGRGREMLAAEPDALGRLARSLSPDAPATIIYTSGTTGHPKGAIYRHGPHLAACANIIEHYPILAGGEHRAVAMLPLCHAMGRNLAITMPLIADVVPHYPESVDTFVDALYEIQPTFVFTVPRYLQKFAAHLLVGLDQSSWIKRAAYHAAMRVGRRALDRRWSERRPARAWALLAVLARVLVFRWLLEKAGFARVELVISSGAPLPAPVATLWQAWGVNLCEAYGQTETGGALVSGQRGPYPVPGDVGVAAPNMAVELDADGEILVTAGEGFGGYWRDPDATEALYRDGKLATGDVGEWTTERSLRLVDRKRDILITAGGKNVNPAHVENRLRASPYVSEAAVFGEGRKYLVALLEADAETVAEWARERGVVYTSYASLVAHPEVLGLIGAEVKRANDDLTRVEQVKAFRLLPRELDPELEGEPVTPTRKVKRRLMAERYGTLVESMYAGDEERRIAAEVASLSTEE